MGLLQHALVVLVGYSVLAWASAGKRAPPPAPPPQAACTAGHPTSAMPFCNMDLPSNERVWDLIGRLNVTEKVSLLTSSRVWVPQLGIHSLEGNECLHGLFNRGTNVVINGKLEPLAVDGAATIFPQSIGMAATWNRTLLHGMGDVISTEAVAKRNEHRRNNDTQWPFYLTCWAPVINIARDTRWGRTPETYGEDPLLTRELAMQVVRGLQGNDPRYRKVSAAPKHFTVYDGPESSQPGAPDGRMSFNAKVPPEDLDQTWLDHWKTVVQGSGVHPLGGVMCSYSACNGVPMCGNRELLTDTLRTEWGFEGWVVSDCGAISNIATEHKFVNSTAAAAALAISAGCDIECDSAFSTLPSSISNGSFNVREADVDTSLFRIFQQQVSLGVFDDPARSPYNHLGAADVDSASHRQLAREAAQQSAVLLANVGGMLPLDLRAIKTIAVVGPSANDTAGYNRCFDAGGGGCLYSHIYRGYSSFITTPLMGIQRAVAEHNARINNAAADGSTNITVTYIAGVPDRTGNDKSGIAAAAALAAAADVVFVVVGLEERLEEEGTDRMAKEGDTSYPHKNGLFFLPGVQQLLVDAVAATKTPTVEVLLNGGPLSLTPPANATNFAILEAFYGAQACGDGIADVAFGKVAPSGKMPVSAYANTEQAGDITSMDMAQGLGRTYRYLQAEPTYPFGFGLSYTQWEFSPMASNASTAVDEADVVAVHLQVKNVGAVDSAQVVQLYGSLAPDFASNPLMVSKHVAPRQLVAFQKIFVKAGEAADVSFAFQPAAMSGWSLWHKPLATVHLAAGDVSPTASTIGSLRTLAIAVRRR